MIAELRGCPQGPTEFPNLIYDVIVAIYLFGVCIACGCTPLRTLYAVECLENRAGARKNPGSMLVSHIAMVVNTYGISAGVCQITCIRQLL